MMRQVNQAIHKQRNDDMDSFDNAFPALVFARTGRIQHHLVKEEGVQHIVQERYDVHGNRKVARLLVE